MSASTHEQRHATHKGDYGADDTHGVQSACVLLTGNNHNHVYFFCKAFQEHNALDIEYCMMFLPSCGQ